MHILYFMNHTKINNLYIGIIHKGICKTYWNIETKNTSLQTSARSFTPHLNQPPVSVFADVLRVEPLIQMTFHCLISFVSYGITNAGSCTRILPPEGRLKRNYQAESNICKQKHSTRISIFVIYNHPKHLANPLDPNRELFREQSLFKNNRTRPTSASTQCKNLQIQHSKLLPQGL